MVTVLRCVSKTVINRNISRTLVITFLHPINVYRVSRQREQNQVSESTLLE